MAIRGDDKGNGKGNYLDRETVKNMNKDELIHIIAKRMNKGELVDAIAKRMNKGELVDAIASNFSMDEVVKMMDRLTAHELTHIVQRYIRKRPGKRSSGRYGEREALDLIYMITVKPHLDVTKKPRIQSVKYTPEQIHMIKLVPVNNLVEMQRAARDSR